MAFTVSQLDFRVRFKELHEESRVKSKNLNNSFHFLQVARFICAIIVVIAWMSDYHGNPTEEMPKKEEAGPEDPYEWISREFF